MAVVPNVYERHIKGNNCWGNTPILNEETKAIWSYWKKKKTAAEHVGLPFLLSGAEMSQLFTEAGITAADIGTGSQQYCLGRYGDSGGYEMDNCRFITARENHQEKSWVRPTGMKSGKMPHAVAIMIDGKRYESMSEGARATVLSRPAVLYRTKSPTYPDWYRIK